MSGSIDSGIRLTSDTPKSEHVENVYIATNHCKERHIFIKKEGQFVSYGGRRMLRNGQERRTILVLVRTPLGPEVRQNNLI